MATETIDIVVTENGSRTVRRNFADLGDQALTTANAVDTLKTALIGISLGALIREVIAMADAYTTLQNKLAGAGVETGLLTALTKELFDIANQTRASVEATAAIYSRLALSSKELGTSQQELLDFTKSLNQALILSGATGHEAAAGLLQLSQAIASNRLGGDELRSVLEQLPVVADVIAKQMKVTRGELRALGTQGKLTADVILQAFASARQELNERFAKTVPTISQSFQVLKNGVIQFVGELDKAEGFTRTLSQAILYLGLNFETVGKALLVLSAGVAVFAGAGGISAAVRAWAALNAVMLANPFVAVLALIAALVTGIAVFGDQILLGVDDLTTLKDLSLEFVKQAKDGFNELLGISTQLWQGFRTDGTTAMQDLTLQYGSGFAAINGTVEAFSKDFGQIFTDMFRNTGVEIDGIVGTFNAGVAIIEKVWNDVFPVLQQGWADFAAGVVTTWDTMTGTIKEGWVNTTTFIATSWDSMKTIVSDFVSTSISFIGAWATAIGDTVGNALPASIKGFFSEVYNWVVELFQKLLVYITDVVNAIKDLLGQATSDVKMPAGGTFGLDWEAGANDRKKTLDNLKIYFGEIGNVARKALEDSGNPVTEWVNNSINAAKNSAKDRKDFQDMFAPARPDLTKKGPNVAKPPAGKTKDMTKTIESLQRQYLELLKAIDPASKVTAEWQKEQNFLNKALKLGAITSQEFAYAQAKSNEHLRDSVDDASKSSHGFTDLLTSMSKVQEKLGNFGAAAQLRQVSAKYPDLFFGTDQEIKNKVADYQETQSRINQLQQAGLVTEAQANQMRIIQAGQLKNAIIEAGLQAANFRLQSGAGDWADVWLTALGRVQQGFTTFSAGTSAVLSEFYQSMIDGFANSIGRAIVYSENLGDAIYKVAQGALASLISGFIKLGIQWLINQAIGTALASASTAASVAMGATVAAAWAPAAVAVSLATFGANAGPAIAGMALAAASQSAIGIAGGLLGGGSGSTFASGGYTGNTPRNQIAGAVHGREFVMNAAATSRIGVPTLEAMQSGKVSPMAANNNRKGAPVQSRKPNVTIQNFGTSKDFQVQYTENDIRIMARDEARTVARKETPGIVASDLNNPNGATSKAMNRNIAANRRR